MHVHCDMQTQATQTVRNMHSLILLRGWLCGTRVDIFRRMSLYALENQLHSPLTNLVHDTPNILWASQLVPCNIVAEMLQYEGFVYAMPVV